MKRLRKKITLTLWLTAIFLTILTPIGMAADVNKMTAEQLKEIMGGDTVSILDVRRQGDWNSSEYKIKGADRRDPKNYDSWSDNYPKDNTLILYCA